MKGMDIAARARALVGTRFRPQGRSRQHGLDCVGTAAAAAGVPAGRVPSGYTLRGQRLPEIERGLCGLGCKPVAGRAVRPGDIAVCRAGPAQFHMAVIVPGAFVHADASLRRVVERPLPLPWPVVGYWRAGEEEM